MKTNMKQKSNKIMNNNNADLFDFKQIEIDIEDEMFAKK